MTAAADPTRPPARFRPASGFAAIEFVAGIGFLVLPIALLVLSLPVWAETQTAARAVARESGRTLATAADDDTGRREAAAMAERVAANLDVELAEPPRFAGTVEGPPGEAAVVRATITVHMPLVAVPFMDDLTAVDWTVEHAEPVDPYRSRP